MQAGARGFVMRYVWSWYGGAVLVWRRGHQSRSRCFHRRTRLARDLRWPRPTSQWWPGLLASIMDGTARPLTVLATA